MWAMVYLLQAYFGRDGREEAEAMLERHSGDPDKPRILEAFNEETPDWLSFFMFTYFTDRDGKPDGTPKYDLVQPIYEKELNKIKAKWIKKYIDMCYKIIRKYKPQIKRHILSQKNKPSEYGWNEIIVNQIHVQDVFLIDSLMYKNTAYRDKFIKQMEKIAKG